MTLSSTSSIPWSINSNADFIPLYLHLVNFWNLHADPDPDTGYLALASFSNLRGQFHSIFILQLSWLENKKTMWIDDTAQIGCLFGADPCSFCGLKQLLDRRKPLNLFYFTNFLPFKCKARWFFLKVLILTIKAHGFVVTLSFLVLFPLQIVLIFFYFMCLTCSSFSSEICISIINNDHSIHSSLLCYLEICYTK